MTLHLGNKGMLPCDGTIQPSPPESIFDIINRSKLIYNAEFWAGHWVGVTNKSRIAMDVTSGK